MVMNSAFCFIKPHANFPEARKVMKEEFAKKNIKVLSEGQIEAKEIDEKQLIDNHYYAIASKATILKPSELNVPKKMFSDKFGLDWDETLAKGNIVNATDACTKFGVDSEGLNTHWAKSKKAGKLVKFGGGFYCGLVDSVEGKSPLYVMNGFFMSMRQNFVAPGASIYYFTVSFDSANTSWSSFRNDVLGPTDPATAPEGSLRRMFFDNWESYGLEYVPNVGDNAVHASASPFEALCEKCNWLGQKAEEDKFFGKDLLSFMDAKTFKEWSVDPAVKYGISEVKKSVFDSVEDMDGDMCLNFLAMMYTQQEKARKPLEECMKQVAAMSVGA